MKNKLIFLFLLIFQILTVFGNQSIVIIPPFNQTGNSTIDEKLLSNSISFTFANKEKYDVIHTNKIIEFLNKNSLDFYSLHILTNKANLQKYLKADYLISGNFHISSNNYIFTFIVYPKNQIETEFKIIKPVTKDLNIDTFNKEIAEELFKSFQGYDPELGTISFITPVKCSIYINSEFFKFSESNIYTKIYIPEGYQNITIKYENSIFNHIIFERKINLHKKENIDLGEIKVFATLAVKANVNADVLINNKKIGTTNNTFNIPVNNNFIVKTNYIDNNNDSIYYVDTISTFNYETPILIDHIFQSRIITIGNEKLLTNLNNEIQSLNNKYELFPGEYILTLLITDNQSENTLPLLKLPINLGKAESLIIDLSDYSYTPEYWKCFIPGVAQFHNYQNIKGSLIVASSILTSITSIVFLAISKLHYDTYYSPTILNPKGFSMEDVNLTINNQKLYNNIAIGSIFCFGIIYIYSAIDGMLTTNHKLDLFIHL